ncbi:RICIN domain-containing protein [Streptomyces griseofuscus]|uniref:RICIN domain-containing protein n=1 Tax=Streptomyces griseofuscus TaxID=146922 RepID=UPI00367EDCB2
MDKLKAVQLMPSVPELFDRARALALVDGLHEPHDEDEGWDGWEDGGYRLERRAGHESCLLLSAQHAECRFVDVHFSDAGCLVLVYEVDGNAKLFDDDLRAALTARVPVALHGCSHSKCAPFWLANGDGTYAGLGSAMWRTPVDETWQQTIFTRDEIGGPDAKTHAVMEREIIEVLTDLISPRPEQFVLGTRNVRGDDLEDVTWPGTGLTRPEAFRHVMALRPLTEQVVRTLNPHIPLDDAVALADRLGYPRDGSRAQGQVPGTGTPVAAGDSYGDAWAAWTLEAAQDGGHRICARCSGTVWEAVGEGDQARVIHTEPRPCDGQRFIVQRVGDDGTYTETDTWERYGRYRILSADSRLAVEVPADGGPLFLAPPHGGPSQRFEAEYVFLGDADFPERDYHLLQWEERFTIQIRPHQAGQAVF